MQQQHMKMIASHDSKLSFVRKRLIPPRFKGINSSLYRNDLTILFLLGCTEQTHEKILWRALSVHRVGIFPLLLFKLFVI